MAKAAPHKAPSHRSGGAVAHSAPAGGLEPKGSLPDGDEGCRQGRQMGQDDGQGPGQIKHRHQGHQLFGGRGHALHPPPEDQPGGGSQQGPGQQRGQAEDGVEGGGNGVGLAQVADAKGGQNAQQGKQPRQHPAQGPAAGPGTQPGRQIVHGPAPPLAAVELAVLQPQQVFSVGGHHPEKGHHPHPEDGSRPAAGQGHPHPNHAAGADGSPQGGAEALEGADAARPLPGQVGAAGQQGPQGLPQPQPQVGQLEPACPDRQPQPGPCQQAHSHRAPYGLIQRGEHSRSPPSNAKKRSHTPMVQLLFKI